MSLKSYPKHKKQPDMKKLINNITKTLLILSMAIGLSACTPDEFKAPEESGLPLATDYESYISIEVNQETNYVTFNFNAKGVTPIWIIDGTYNTSFHFEKYYRKAGEYSVDIKIANSNGISDGTITKTFTINKTIMNGFGGFDYESEYNMWKNANPEAPTFYYAPGWTQINDPECTTSNGGYTINLPQATSEQWQAQMFVKTDIATESSKNYDFSVILTSATDHPGVTVKFVHETDDNIFYFADRVSLKANEPYCYWKSDLKGLDISKMRLVFDFGGNSENTNITIENIVIKDHANNDGTVLPEVDNTNWIDVDSDYNLWKGVEFTTSFYYAPGWTQIADPSFEINGNKYTLIFPKATTDQWQNQVFISTESLTFDPANEYDFKVTINSSGDIANATVKMQEDTNNDIALFTENAKLIAGEDVEVKVIKCPGVMIEKAKLVFDFGGNPDNTTVTIKDIIIQIHSN